MIILTRVGTIGLLIAGLTLGTWLSHLPTASAGTVVPTRSPSPMIGTLADRAIRVAEAQIARNPQKGDGHVALATAYMRKVRESGDTGYYSRDEAAVQRALKLQPKSYKALRILALIETGKHEFRRAMTTAEGLRQRRPDDYWVHGLLGDAHVELGDYERAAVAYQKMIDLRPGLASYSRAAHLRALYGDPQGATELMAMAIRAGSRRDPETLAWCLVQFGKLRFNQGSLRAAEAAYQKALSVFPDSYLALGALGRLRGAQERYAKAINLYRRSVAIVPAPDTVAALGDIYRKVGRFREAEEQYDLVEYIGYLNTLNRVLYNRELAYFYADHDIKLKESLDLAKKELEVRRDIYGYDVLAWALYKNGKPQEALAVITEALKLGTKDARLFFHAGMIYRALGNDEKAKEYLSRTLATNPYFHIFQADVARAMLREIEQKDSGRMAQ